MDVSFTASDRLRALCAPLTCCLPSCRLLPSERDAQESNEIGSGGDHRLLHGQRSTRAQASQDGSSSLDEREAELLSLHEATNEQAPYRPRPRIRMSRRRAATGDVTGGGADDGHGSGLSRWTLFKSWWTGQGRIRLPDDETDLYSHSAASVSSGGSGAGAGDNDGDRARRRAERRARELGLTLDEFDNGAPATITAADNKRASLAASTSASASASTSTRRSRSDERINADAPQPRSTAAPPSLPSNVPLPMSPPLSTTSERKKRNKKRKHLSFASNSTSTTASSASHLALPPPASHAHASLSPQQPQEAVQQQQQHELTYVYMPDINGQMQTYVPVVYEGNHYLVDSSGAYHAYTPVTSSPSIDDEEAHSAPL